MPTGVYPGRHGPERKRIKRCTGCGRDLPRSDFYARANGQVVPKCIECARLAARLRDPVAESRAKATHRVKHQEKISEYRREYGQRPSAKSRRLALLSRRKSEDQAFAIECRLRTSLADKIRKAKTTKCAGTMAILGCSIADFMAFIGGNFQPGMTWDNWGRGRGKWNLDHIRPVSSFDLTQPHHQARCFHFANFQPLWSIDNLRKGSKMPEGMCGI